MGLLSSAAGGLVGSIGSLAGSYLSNKSAQNINLLNYKQAKEFAQNQIQWKVADAKKAGAVLQRDRVPDPQA